MKSAFSIVLFSLVILALGLVQQAAAYPPGRDFCNCHCYLGKQEGLRRCQQYNSPEICDKRFQHIPQECGSNCSDETCGIDNFGGYNRYHD
ncbi:hypothetical protein O0I10_004439 [Lichtheimia ornata]|uniref:Uncharacterized protein n=1 Tax=Lichtheimia ornata TaxID=688661 RepID=A0AAD7V941_9FUNG|nr:uncharacterized protein O0I10_004439 [Lichtheimia ornata]KAJ8659846.1 hypothetical protein O0I10_004439 [Lichtheimia ornata]